MHSVKPQPTCLNSDLKPRNLLNLSHNRVGSVPLSGTPPPRRPLPQPMCVAEHAASRDGSVSKDSRVVNGVRSSDRLGDDSRVASGELGVKGWERGEVVVSSRTRVTTRTRRIFM